MIEPDGPRGTLRLGAAAARALRLPRSGFVQDFFSQDPEVTDIWLMKNSRIYRALTRRRLKTEPSSPYGFYLAAQHAMVMNLSTGSGTLVHALVHHKRVLAGHARSIRWKSQVSRWGEWSCQQA